MKIPKVAVVAYNRFSPFHLSVPCIVFAPQGLPSLHLFEMKLCAGEPGDLLSDEGFSCNTQAGLEAIEAADIVIVPGWRDPDDSPPQALLDNLTAAHARGAMIVGLCLGTYVLAYAGLLNGRKASTHWEFEQDFSGRFPCVQLDTNALYVMDRNLLTSAGTAAGLDCCLHVVREIHGSLVANRLARRLVVPPHRDGGQAQYIEQPVPHSTHDTLVNQLLDFLRANISKDLAIDALAERMSMSRRTFTRHFQKATGMSVGNWLRAERMRAAQVLLESGNESVERIADQVGFRSATAFRLQFKKKFGVSPTEWRGTFHIA